MEIAFRNPVNQRGQDGYAGNGYGIDRWQLAGGQGNAIALTPGGAKHSTTARSAAEGILIFQICLA